MDNIREDMLRMITNTVLMKPTKIYQVNAFHIIIMFAIEFDIALPDIQSFLHNVSIPEKIQDANLSVSDVCRCYLSVSDVCLSTSVTVSFSSFNTAVRSISDGSSIHAEFPDARRNKISISVVGENEETQDDENAHVSGFLKCDMEFVSLRDDVFSNVENLSSNYLSLAELLCYPKAFHFVQFLIV